MAILSVIAGRGVPAQVKNIIQYVTSERLSFAIFFLFHYLQMCLLFAAFLFVTFLL